MEIFTYYNLELPHIQELNTNQKVVKERSAKTVAHFRIRITMEKDIFKHKQISGGNILFLNMNK